MSENTTKTETKPEPKFAAPASAQPKAKKAPAKKAGVKKPAPKAKAKKASAAGAKRGPRAAAKFAGKKVKVLVKDNPKREGTRAFKVWAVYKNGLPVEKLFEEGKKLGFTSADLRYDLAHEFIALQ
jgi:hypothetical protein